MNPRHILSLADKMASAFEAKGIPNGDLYRSITHDAWVRARAALMEAIESQAAELARITAERDALQARLNALSEQSLLKLVADLRWALGDNGKRMQPELIEYAKALRADAERLDFLEHAWFYKDSEGVISFGFNECWDAGKHKNLRAAIDAARAQESA